MPACAGMGMFVLESEACICAYRSSNTLFATLSINMKIVNFSGNNCIGVVHCGKKTRSTEKQIIYLFCVSFIALIPSIEHSLKNLQLHSLYILADSSLSGYL